MKNNVAKLILTVSIVGLNSYALAETLVMPSSLSTMLEKAMDKGYTICEEIEKEDNVYMAEAIDSKGRPVEIRLDPMTGEVNEAYDNGKMLSMLDVVNLLEEKGYHNISDIRFKRSHYKVIAYNVDDMKIRFRIDAYTGAISPRWQDYWF